MRWLLAALLTVVPTVASADVSVQANVTVGVDVTAPPPSPPPAAPPAAVAVSTPPAANPGYDPDRRHPGTLGLSVFASGGALLDTRENMQGQGFALRLHPLDNYPIEVAIETERDTYEFDARSDWRIGYSIHYTIPTNTFVAPYVVFPMGVNIVSLPDHDAFAQGYIGIGGGLAFHFGPHWLATVDARIISRNEDNKDMDPVLGPERVGEVRGAGVYYF